MDANETLQAALDAHLRSKVLLNIQPATDSTNFVDFVFNILDCLTANSEDFWVLTAISPNFEQGTHPEVPLKRALFTNILKELEFYKLRKSTGLTEFMITNTIENIWCLVQDHIDNCAKISKVC